MKSSGLPMGIYNDDPDTDDGMMIAMAMKSSLEVNPGDGVCKAPL